MAAASVSLPLTAAPPPGAGTGPGSASRPGEPATTTSPTLHTLIDALLERQRELTAVEAFADRNTTPASADLAPNYRRLLPLTAPRPGEQYAFEVDLDRCSGCKACVTACHSLNGLEDAEAWRDVGLLIGTGSKGSVGPTAPPVQQTVTTACHHCVEPGCLLGCPVLAYDKDPVTGIVRHLDDQCIGCSYCILKCPYDVPKFSRRLGIVRKCDLCHGRLAVGEAPACVQACPDEAIRITLVRPEALRDRWRPAPSAQPTSLAADWLPDAPDPAVTLPTTLYRTVRGRLPLQAADRGQYRLEAAHWPLIAMTLLTQTAAGLFATGAVGQFFGSPFSEASLAVLAMVAMGFLLAGLGAAGFHLGRPLRAWRSFLGWRTSWLSREILAFGGFGAAAAWVVGTTWWPGLLGPFVAAPLLSWTLTASVGLISIFASAMVYIDTQRTNWSAPRTLTQFFGSTVLLGASWAAAVWSATSSDHTNLRSVAQGCALIAMVLRTILFVTTEWRARCALRHPEHPGHASAQVLAQHLPWRAGASVTLWALATLSDGLGLTVTSSGAMAAALVGALLTTAAQGIERYAYFVGVAPRRMPGIPA